MQKIVLFVLLSLPLIGLSADIYSGYLIDPIEEITNTTGQWALRFLLLSLAITPLNKISQTISLKISQKTNQTIPAYPLVKFRRMIGVFSFFYVCLHLTIWLIDQQFSIEFITADIIKRSYITIGFCAFIILLLLALTSTDKMLRRLGRKWKILHRFVYLASVLAVVHFYWQAKSSMDIEPMIYAAIALILLAFRWSFFKRLITRKG